jgi:hypothetical protein
MNSLEKFLEINEGDLDARATLNVSSINKLTYEEMTEDQQWAYVEGMEWTETRSDKKLGDPDQLEFDFPQN